MNVLVSGAAGFIGSHLSRILLDRGDHVIGADNFATGQRGNIDDLARRPGFRFIECDICRPLPDTGPIDAVFNMACPASPVDFRDKAVDIMRVCSHGVENLLELSRQRGAVFLQASTSECYGDPLEHPQREEYWGNVNPIGPRSPYDEGKRFAEALTMSYHRLHGLPTRIVRIFNTYGPHMRADDGRALPTFIAQALAGQPLTVHGDGSQTRSFCYVDDLVDGILRLAASHYVEPVNIGNDTEITLRQAAEAVIELTGSRSELRLVPRPKDDPERRRPDLTRAKSILGWQPTMPWREGFLRTINYFRAR